MNLPKINSNLPYLRDLTNTNHQMSCSINSKSTYSSTISSLSSNKSKELNPIPILIQLCIYPNENYAFRTMRLLLSSRYDYSPNICDEFGCNLLMYSLRYQRYRLFEFLLNDLSLDLNFHAKDRYGNTIFHYIIIYGGNDNQIIEKLIEKYQKFSMKIDERNNFGFTPLLLAAFCGRYDLVLILLTKTDASPFVRDHIQLKSMFDYIENDMNYKECQISQKSSRSNFQSKHLNYQLYQTIPSRRKIYNYKNFFEIFLLRSIQDQSGFFRLLIIQLIDFKYLSLNLTNLLNYLNQRYPKIKIPRRLKDNTTTKFILQRENSKINVHNILNLFDPTLKPKAMRPPEIITSTSKTKATFKRLSAKVTAVSAFSKTPVEKKHSSITTTHIK